MSFRKHCPKCFAFFMDEDIFNKHVAVCGYASEKKSEAREPVAVSRRDEPEVPESSDVQDVPAQTATGEESAQPESEGSGSPTRPRGRPPKFQV